MDEENLKEGSPKYHMVGGDGPNSYVQNSEYQKQIIISAENLIHELTKEHLDIKNPHFHPQNTFRIADFGCSVGPNTFFAVQNIISAITNEYKNKSSNQTNPQIPEFHVFFNDLVQNDFNTLFNNIPSSTRQSYFIAAVPGSFHGRLFPNSTLHFAHSSTALHWMSRIPEKVMERNSTVWNKGRVHYSGAGKEVKEAYWEQYKEDMEVFLSARGKEIVDGGLMVLVILGFPDGVMTSESSIGIAFDILGSCLHEMASMGRFDEEKLDSFNLPFYYPSPSELKALIEANGWFSIERMVGLTGPISRIKPTAQVTTCHLRAVIGELIEQHFGHGIVEDLFQLHCNKLTQTPTIFDPNYWKETNYFVFLKKKYNTPLKKRD